MYGFNKQAGKAITLSLLAASLCTILAQELYKAPASIAECIAYSRLMALSSVSLLMAGITCLIILLSFIIDFSITKEQ